MFFLCVLAPPRSNPISSGHATLEMIKTMKPVSGPPPPRESMSIVMIRKYEAGADRNEQLEGWCIFYLGVEWLLCLDD